MNILTLSEEQKKKLLVLCKKFFPEYISKINNHDDPDASVFEIEGIILFGGSCFGTDFHIREKTHWYQLCLTELPKRIIYSLNFPITIAHLVHIYPEDIEQEYIERVGEIFDWFDDKKQLWFANNSDNPDLLEYKDVHYKYGKDGYRKSGLDRFPIASPDDFLIEIKEEYLARTLSHITSKTLEHPVDYLYNYCEENKLL